MKKELHIEITEDAPLQNNKVVNILSEHTKLSKQVIKQAMKKGAFWLEDKKGVHRLRRADTMPPCPSTLHFYYDPDILSREPPKPILLADEKDYSVWIKPPELLSQGSKWGDHCTINRWIESNQPFEIQPQRNCFVIHRLDKAATGLMLIAHKKSTAARLSALFENREITKKYQVIVEGEFPKETLIMDSEINKKSAYSSAKMIEYYVEKNRSLLEVDIQTGRKHQIRIHLSHAGYPVVGDSLHGTSPKDNTEGLQLTAHSLEFTCPITQKQRLYTLPKESQLKL